jgi:hypothetical protein
MTRVPVDQAPAGPALDAVVAEMQYTDVVIDLDHCRMVSSEGICEIPRYSTDIAVAWELVEDVRKSGWADFIDELEAGADSIDPFEVFHYLSPLTITRAYLKAKGIEEIDIPD